jgi:hypothetical protein
MNPRIVLGFSQTFFLLLFEGYLPPRMASADPVEAAWRKLLRRTSGPLTSDGADLCHRSLLK